MKNDINDFAFQQRLKSLINSYILDIASLKHDLLEAIHNGTPKRYKMELAYEIWKKQQTLQDLKLHNFKKLNFKI